MSDKTLWERIFGRPCITVRKVFYVYQGCVSSAVALYLLGVG